MNGKIFPVYKPKGISSFDVIRKLRSKYPKEKMGHGGTLDPLADGVLVIGIGKEATKKLHDILHGVKKTYEAQVTLGKTSPTDDAEGPITEGSTDIKPDLETVQTVLKQFVGNIQQVPPIYSAVKINGQPAYKLARKGIPFELQPKPVIIYSIDIVSYTYPELTIRTEVGSGVYIRSLARDIGAALKTGAYLSGLTRTAVGTFSIDQAIKIK